MQKESVRIAVAQINPTVGDLEGNSRKITKYIQKAKENSADIVVFPELALCGYPPEDLLLKPKFIADNLLKLKELTKDISDIAVVVGFVDREAKDIFNAAAVIYNGKLKGVYRKAHLPNYGVFDEKRYFKPGIKPLIFKFGKVIFGVNICEDIWYPDGPVKTQALCGAKLILNINASPYHAGKIKIRQKILQQQAKTNHVFIVYTNLVGGQDELVFDGQSMLVNDKGGLLGIAEAFKEDLFLQDLDILPSNIRPKQKVIAIAGKIPCENKKALPERKPKVSGLAEEVYQALSLGLKDYVTKNGFQKAVVGLSGGIDSALVAVLAVDALGRENVSGVFMPSRYSSAESQEDAQKLAENLGIKFLVIPIEEIFKIYLISLEAHFSGLKADITEENLQARIRGNILMALSNKFGWLVLTTGNKSEMSTGYATLYGDMAGGLAVIKDVPKTLVYKLCEYRNSLRFVIPERVITKEPTAELRLNQKDSDTLPPYPVLDPILKAYVEDDLDLNKIIGLGFDKETVYRVLTMVDKNEYKRRQSPPGIKITPKAFGRDRRMPITNKYRG